MVTGAAARREPAELSHCELELRVTGAEARCAKTAVPADEWFPMTAHPVKARDHAWRALALCGMCLVRAECLELALRDWRDTGQHGIWGGTLEHERRKLREDWLAGADVRDLLDSVHDRRVNACSGHRPGARRSA